jgi:hypothetical protein
MVFHLDFLPLSGATATAIEPPREGAPNRGSSDALASPEGLSAACSSIEEIPHVGDGNNRVLHFLKTTVASTAPTKRYAAGSGSPRQPARTWLADFEQQ